MTMLSSSLVVVPCSDIGIIMGAVLLFFVSVVISSCVTTVATLARNFVSMVLMQCFLVFCVVHVDHLHRAMRLIVAMDTLS